MQPTLHPLPCTGADPVRMARVKNALGCAFQPLLGNVNGYYSLNLAVDTDRLCLSHLLGHSKSVNTKRSKQQAKNLMNYNNYSIGKVNDIIYTVVCIRSIYKYI